MKSYGFLSYLSLPGVVGLLAHEDEAALEEIRSEVDSFCRQLPVPGIEGEGVTF